MIITPPQFTSTHHAGIDHTQVTQLNMGQVIPRRHGVAGLNGVCTDH